jgi:hypothetical protein
VDLRGRCPRSAWRQGRRDVPDFVTYDAELAAAATDLGFPVAAPL